MNATVIGSQFGDEGKGRMTDIFGEGADVVVRFQGGNNAGHTITVGGEEYALRLVPSGVVRGKTGVVGNGCVVGLDTLFTEIDALRERGLDPDVLVSDRAHVVLPYHRVLDDVEEAARDEETTAVGTTGNGIGPAYADKAGRHGIRVGELLDAEALRTRLEHVVSRKRAYVEAAYDVETGDEFDVEGLFEEFRAYGRRLDREGLVVDASSFLAEREDAAVLFEGAQGTHLDRDHGGYPFVTSSNPTAGGAVVGSGVPPQAVADGEIIGVVKAYLSRVGAGPMPTEFEGEVAAEIRERAGEFGTVTGRPRRIGWLDLPMLRHAARVNGFTAITLSHLDVLAGLDELVVCDAYELDGERVETVPSSPDEWTRCEPRFERFETWDDRDWIAVAEGGYGALPENARAYAEYVADELDVPIYALGVGPGREATIVRENPLVQGRERELEA
ncbi:adenylosuccinate synthase [Halorubellus sp. JP-L1]|uniref:adenylosuccinate synthase n=1 Tax=Halorubellus sp. JP-L1 TaxID=2715753 RepID=UPI001408C67D|nr:adenylosuccinate synthase [Halorubellus sp. JP-L1]